MKSFDDFLKELNSEKIATEAFHASYQGETDLEIMSKSNRAFTILLLRAYHEWLTTELSSNNK